MEGISILEPKNETQISFDYLKDKINKLFKNYSKTFNPDLRKFFKDIASKEKKTLTTSCFQWKFHHHLKSLLVFLIGMVICISFVLLYCLIKV